MIRYDRIHDLRLERGFTMEELGKKIGVGKATIKKYESGIIENIPSDKIEALADALDTEPGYLMGWYDIPSLNDSRIERMIYELNMAKVNEREGEESFSDAKKHLLLCVCKAPEDKILLLTRLFNSVIDEG